ncbi:IS701 family transposase [Sphingomonas populi]|uniref:IS701 family transposase n=2 Tax=Sphingomonas populi TaxID=2484750 RepID=A0A4Q6XNW1_9SPHN|nr:IS701 family transposase [Sphingomonas populi]RZF58279.1 IS701 family transposase [Sphingomonas populi]
MVWRSWMTGASIETTLELWASGLRDAKTRMRAVFKQARVAASAGLFLDGLLGDARRKTGWMRAELAGDPGPWRQQALLGRAHWDADALRDVVRDYALEVLSDDDAVLVIDETGFLKQGKGSCGVHRQYTGSAGKITNCQIGVFAAYVSRHGHALIDRALYLPEVWTNDTERMKRASVPEGAEFATKPQLAVEMIKRAIAAQVPFRWVAADSVYGVGTVEKVLRREGIGYVLGVRSDYRFIAQIEHPSLDAVIQEDAADADPTGWIRLSAGDGTKGPRLHDWSYHQLGDVDPEDYDAEWEGQWTRGLLLRRNINDGDIAYFSTWCPKGTTLHTLVAVEGRRWAIEDSFETTKNELGLDHNETRSWHGWYRHVSLVMLAFAMVTTIRHKANTGAEKKLPKLPKALAKSR